ncbi:MAG TPA: four-carbon acid sugar kinase family protein [Chloroflexota bacterium]|nr:four-carbon acid sugar kinase family protein [Chloroflexota bacterium]
MGLPSTGIIADDLTGACDTGVQFARHGSDVIALIGDAPATIDADVIVVDTDSRSRSPAEAARRSAQASRQIRSLGVRRLYKKIDSTLRGNVAAESFAAAEEAGLSALLVAPAFPETGRTTVDGQLLIGGIPVHQTPFARDPLHPVTSATIGDLFLPAPGTAPGHQVRQILLSQIRRGPKAIAERVTSLTSRGARVVIADAETDDDLSAIATALSSCPNVLPVGSAGLASALASLWSSPGSDRSEKTIPNGGGILPVGMREDKQAGRLLSQGPAQPNDRIMVVCGSLHPISRRQSDVVACRYGPARSVDTEHLTDVASTVIHDLDARGVALICTLDERTNPVEAAAAVAHAVRVTYEQSPPDALVIAGGETARMVCQALGAHGIRIRGQVQPGVPHGRLVGGIADGRAIVTKAGGFGDEQTLVAAVEFLRGSQ